VHLRRGWLVTFGAIGTGSIIYVFVVRGILSPGQTAGEGLGWPLFGVLPLYAFGMWLLTATSSRVAFYVALGGTASAVGSAYETYVWTHLEVLDSGTFALLNQIGLTADALSAIGFLLMFATFPDGVLERRWQRIAVRFVWIGALIGPATLLTDPHVVLPEYIGLDNQSIPNPYAVPALSALAPVVDAVIKPWWLIPGLALVVFYSRWLFGPPGRRDQLRVMGVTVTSVMLVYMLWYGVALTQYAGTPFASAVAVLVAITIVALPVAGIHGILRHGAYDVGMADRGKLVVRSSSTLITILYGWGVAMPGLLLATTLPVAPTVVITAAVAVILLPVRAWLGRGITRLVFGNRDAHLTLLGELGSRLEQAVDVDEVLARLAQAVRDGLGATWVRIRLVAPDGRSVDAPRGVVGEVTGEPAAGHDLVRGDLVLGRIDVGPARHGAYTLPEITLLGTVARQATTAVANVRLTAELADQLDELTESRARLITAQDAERRRIERDLHDGIQQSVVALIAGVRLARNRLDRGDLRSAELTDLQEQAREILADLRELAHGIHPQVLSDNGLVAAVESRTARFPVPLTIEADVAVRAQRFGAEVETVAFYTIREALANIAKHADATSARITLALTPAGLRIDVTDDGFGFDPHTARAAPAEQTGLANIRDRVAAIDGRFHLESTPRVGTHLVVELPLAAQPEEPGPGEQPSAGAVTGPAVPSSAPARTEPARA
jgi:signal transduction histidine kinase